MRKHVFGEGLDMLEQEWLLEQINDAIKEYSDNPDVPPPESNFGRGYWDLE